VDSGLWTMEVKDYDLPDHTDDVTSVSWSGRGDILASGSSDQTVRLWQTSEDG
jgi:WD40 repeat protein